MNKSAVVKVLNGVGAAYGAVSLLAPGALQRLYGSAHTSPELRQMTRLWGTTMLGMSAISAASPEENYDNNLLAVGATSALSAIAELLAAVADELPLKVALPGAVSSGAIAGACFWARSLK